MASIKPSIKLPIVPSSIMRGLPHDIIRQIILMSTQEERLRKDTLDYWTLLFRQRGFCRAAATGRVQYDALKEVHKQMKQVTRLERDACHLSALPLPGSKQADEGAGIMWRRVWWSRKSVMIHSSLPIIAAFFNHPWDEWDSLLKDRRQKEAITIKQEFLLAQHD
jgi:hypothetical protein